MSTLMAGLVGLPPWLVLAAVFALPAAEAGLLIGVFIPGETAVLIGGVVAQGGGLPLWAVIVASLLGAAAGDQTGFLLGRRYGQRLIDRLPARARAGGGIDRAVQLIRRRGTAAVALGRWVAVLRAVIPGVAGASGMGQARFTVANIAGGAVWATVISTAGYLVGASYESLAKNLGYGGDVVVAVVVGGCVLWWVRSRHARRTAGVAVFDE